MRDSARRQAIFMRAARSRHIQIKFKNSFQGDGMDKSNKHCKEGGFLSWHLFPYCNMDEHVIAFFIFSSPEPKAHGELRPKEKICVFPVTSPKQ